MTKIINPFEKIREAKAIEFCFYVNCNEPKFEESICDPLSYDEVELIAKRDGCTKYDVIRARNVSWSDGQCAIYLGHWNDGII